MTYYTHTAYNSQAIPAQAMPPQRGGLQTFGQIPLPWGNTQSVVPHLFFQEHAPDYMRRHEYDDELKQQMAQGIQAGTYSLDQTGNAIDQQAIRYSPAALRTRLIAIAYAGGKFLTFFLGFFCFITPIFFYYASDLEIATFKEMSLICLMFWLPFPFIWLLCYLIMHFLPNVWFGIGKRGMLWELNRRTGMVSLRKDGFSAPFYEWDAYLHSFPGQSGVIFYKLYLIHRYQQYTVDLTYFSPASNTKWDAYAAWDFVQNYMDISQPIPDIPLLERWRPYDPVTAEYDKKTGRNPKHWLTMDEATWRQIDQAMRQQVSALAPSQRANIMTDYGRD